MKFGQVIEDNKKNLFLQNILQKIKQGDWFETFCFLKKLYIR